MVDFSQKKQKTPRDLPPWAKGKSRLTEDQIEKRREQYQTFRGALGAPSFERASGGRLGEMMSADLACIPASLPATKDYNLPMTQTEFDEQFGSEFALTDFRAQGGGLITKFVAGSAPRSPFLIAGVGLLGRVPPYSFAMSGGAVSRALVEPPRVPPTVPVGGVTDDATARPGLFEYGQAAWRAFTNFLQVYNFSYVLQGRYKLIDERAIDLGVIDSQWGMRGFGTAQKNPIPDINRVNRRYVEIGSDRVFQWPNVTGLAAVGGVDPAPLPAPIVDVQWGGPYAPGVFGCFFPVRRHILFPGQSYQFILSKMDDGAYDDMFQEDMVVRTFDKALDSFADSRAAAAPQPAIWAGAVPFSGAELQIGMMARGADMLPEDTIEWMFSFGQPYMSLLMDNAQVFNSVMNIAKACGLAGLPVPLAPADKRREKNVALAGIGTSRQHLTAAIMELCGDPDDPKNSANWIRGQADIAVHLNRQHPAV